MPATTIDQVLTALDGIIQQSRADASRLGYFCALYRRVTQAVKDNLNAGKFRNGPLIEKLDVVFANRYLDAFALFQNGQQPTASWAVAFQLATDPLPLILQQLLVGINAHINLDLGIATAAVAPGNQLSGIQTDFNQINAVLASLVATVQQELAEVSPAIGLLEELGLRTETTIINFSLDNARAQAWATAQTLASLGGAQLDAAIQHLDARVAVFGQLIGHPPADVDLAIAPIRIPEWDDVPRVIDVLAG